MEITRIAEVLLRAKVEKGLTFAALAESVGRSEIWTAALLYGQAQATPEEAGKILSRLEVKTDREEILAFLTAFPDKGLGPVVPTDPLIYRLYEILQVYGYPLKAVIHEKFGDGIMSAVDFTMEVEREKDPKGDRVRVILSGKYLPYKIW